MEYAENLYVTFVENMDESPYPGLANHAQHVEILEMFTNY
jgi:hypothetical protein